MLPFSRKASLDHTAALKADTGSELKLKIVFGSQTGSQRDERQSERLKLVWCAAVVVVELRSGEFGGRLQ